VIFLEIFVRSVIEHSPIAVSWCRDDKPVEPGNSSKQQASQAPLFHGSYAEY
jgi:hypothetical protein